MNEKVVLIKFPNILKVTKTIVQAQGGILITILDGSGVSCMTQ